MLTGILFSKYPFLQINWTQDVEPWPADIGTVKVTSCLNRFEVLIEDNVPSDAVRTWAHEQLDAWLDEREDMS
jgi:hypothetical protein